jgi:hypothetical protein
LPHRKLKIDFRPHVSVSKQFAEWLERMIEPVAEDRFLSAKEALAVLQGEKEFTRSATVKLHRPTGSPISLRNDGKRLVVEIPSVGLRTPQSQFLMSIPNTFLSVLPAVILGIRSTGYILSQAGWVFLGIYGLFGLWMVGTFLFSAASRTGLEIERGNFRLQRWFLGWCYREIQGRTEEITQVELRGIGLSVNKAPITVCTLRSRLRQHRFGSFLTEPEKAWLVAEVKDFLEKQQTVETPKTPASEA